MESSAYSLIIELFQQCTHSEQLELLQNLSLLLRRDFLVHLPLELVESILSHLDISCVLGSCLRVSKSWYKVILSCDRYWKSVCLRSGLGKENTRREMETLGLYDTVARRWLQRENHLKRHISHSEVNISGYQHACITEEGDTRFTYTFIEPISNGFCLQISTRVSPTLSLLRAEEGVLTVCCTLEDVFPNGIFQVLWSSCTPRSVLLHGNNATWVEFSFQPPGDFHRVMIPPLVSVWEDTIVSNVHNVFARCPQCPLLVHMPKTLNDKKLWEIEFLELRKSSDIVSHFRAEKRFIPDSEVEDSSPFFKVNKIHVYCNGTCRGDFTKEHSMLVQFGFVVVKFMIQRSVQGEDVEYEVSDPSLIFCPFNDPVFYRDVLPTGSFCLSQDRELMALVTAGNGVHSHIWNLESGLCQCQEIDVQDSLNEPLKTVNCISVGRIYCLALITHAGGTKVAIFQTSSGKMVVEMKYSDVTVTAHSCASEKWMNTLTLCLSELFCVAFSKEAKIINYRIRGALPPHV